MEDEEDAPSLLSGLKTPLDLPELCEDEESWGRAGSQFHVVLPSGLHPGKEGIEGRFILGSGGFAEIRMLLGRRWSCVSTKWMGAFFL